ncbi:hypothetical protein S40288_11658 [Stachybotrys chartarum IBT 40288]|nr:hypothetical protein S40288_11658 [Stachybotrys chartarum IBT 40288]
MRIKTTFVLSALLGAAGSNANVCNADNCLRAIRNPAKPGIADCSSYLKSTSTPPEELYNHGYRLRSCTEEKVGGSYAARLRDTLLWRGEIHERLLVHRRDGTDHCNGADTDYDYHLADH